MSSVLVVGGAGFGGSGLVKKLLPNHKIKVIDIIAPNYADSLREEIDSGSIEYVWKAVQDLKISDLEGIDIVCHFAAQADVPMGFPSPEWTFYENVIGTVHLFETIKDYQEQGGKIQKVLIPSSGNVIGRPLYQPIDEKHPVTPHNPYSASKACQEMIAFAYYRSYEIPIVLFRNGIVYGPGMRRDIFLYKWFKNILLGKPIIVEGGDQTRDPCFVTDTIDAWSRAVEIDPKKVVGEIFQVSKGEEYSIRAIADKVCKVAEEDGLDPEMEFTGYRPGEDGQRENFSIKKAQDVLGYEPKVGLDEGLRLLFNDMKENCDIKTKKIS